MPPTTFRSRRAFVVTGAAALASVGVISPPVRAAQYSWKFGNINTTDHPVNVRMTEAFGKIFAETKGAIEIKVFPNSILGGDTGMVEQVRGGSLEMMAETGGVLDGFAPLGSMENVPFAFATEEAAYRAMDGDLGKIVRAQLLEKNIYAFDRISDNGFRNFTTNNKPLRSAADLEGLKMRIAPSRFRVDLFRSLGASPTAVASAELYTALKTHLVDAQESTLQLIHDLRINEVQQYCSLTRHIWGGLWILCNREKFEGLPPSFQEIVRKHVNAGAVLDRHDSAVRERSIRDQLARTGLTFTPTVDTVSFKTKLTSTGFYARWKREFGATAWSALEKYSGPLT